MNFAHANVSTFEVHRPRLFGIAYRMLGSVHDAEDVVQDAYVRWQRADTASLRAPEAWLVSVATRLAIDRLRRTATERQAYVGDWLPAPIATAEVPPADRASELASDLSVAFLLLLDRLGAEERAAFLLRDVFDRGYDEIAEVIGRTPVGTRQMVHRARERVRAERPRFQVQPDVRRGLLDRFMRAIHDDDEAALLALLAPEARLLTDSGGKVSAARKTLVGANRIAHFLLGVQRKWGGLMTHRMEPINGALAVVAERSGRLFSTTSFDTDGERVTALYRVLNPDKLRTLGLANL